MAERHPARREQHTIFDLGLFIFALRYTEMGVCYIALSGRMKAANKLTTPISANEKWFTDPVV